MKEAAAYMAERNSATETSVATTKVKGVSSI